MSVTVNYKGNTIATVDNETKNLTTASTWVEDDIELIDQTPTILVVDSITNSGGTIRNISTQNGVKLQAEKIVTSSESPQTILPDNGYDGFVDGVVLKTTSGVFLTTVATFVGDYTNDTITITSGKIDKFYRRIYGR